MTNAYTTRPLSPWTRVMVHRCNACGEEFRSEHRAAFHACAGKTDLLDAEMNLVGFVDERGEINRTKLDARRREYTEYGGLDLVFTMNAMAFKNLLIDIEAAQEGTIGDKTAMLEKLANMLKEAQ